jgi:peptidoglycan/LPS O-acetylase OafA/YrhL
MNYRSDIDGLRAISILAVVAFHAGIPYIKSGYVGVDVFFVISGFLITKLLFEEKIHTGKIDLAAFWARRVRRILPALLFVITLTLFASLFILQRVSGEIGNLVRATIAALFLNANHHFLMVMGDYFGATAEMNPLLHLWTLSVEEQFYFFWPLVLLIVVGKKHLWRKSLIVAIACISFIGCVVLTSIHREQAFFLMPTRSWEFMCGAGLAVFHFRNLREHKPFGFLIALLGALSLLYSLFLLEDVSQFPGILALYPVVGAAFLILAGMVWSKNPITLILKVSLLTYIGRISYVWYLWHWPVLVFVRSRTLYERHLDNDLVAVAASLLLAVLTHRYVEMPLRRRGIGNPYWNSKRLLFLGGIGTATVCMLALLMGAWVRYGWFYSDKERYLDAARHDLPSISCLFTEGDTPQTYQKCLQVDKPLKHTVFLWGDSHANHWSPAFMKATKNQNTSLVILSRRACLPILGDVIDKGCMEFNSYVFSQLKNMHQNGLQGIILSARWPEYIGTKPISIADAGKETFFFNEEANLNAVSIFEMRLQTLLEEISKMNLRVVIVLPSPILKYAASHCLAVKPASECGISQNIFNEYAKDSISIITRVANNFQNVRLINPQDFMCNDGHCSAIQHEIIVYTDDDHLSKSFAENHSSDVEKDITWLLEAH